MTGFGINSGGNSAICRRALSDVDTMKTSGITKKTTPGSRIRCRKAAIRPDRPCSDRGWTPATAGAGWTWVSVAMDLGYSISTSE